MKKKYGIIAAVVIVVICAVFIFSYFHVAGREIDGVENISDTCTVTVIKYPHLEYEKRTEYVLDAEQILKLKELISDSSFTRVLSDGVTFKDQDMYDIEVDFGNQQELFIHCIGNEYISVIDQFNDKHLKINNSGWQEALDAIILPAETN